MCKKVLRGMARVTKFVFLALAVVLLLSTAIHQVLTAAEKQRFSPLGDMVSVDGQRMSLYVTGSGAHTIVLMPGLGTASPICDFMPLAERLAKNNRVVIVEPFGYGWSDTTAKARTVENIVSELRAALQADHIEGPYVLMPHSISGLDAIYYANTYPDEVAAVVGIDCTLPKMDAYFGETLPEHIPGAAGLLCPMGAMRWITLLSPDNFISENSAGYYSDENMAMQRRIAGWTADNCNVIDQMNHIAQNIDTTQGMAFSPDMPLLFFTRDGSTQSPRADGKTSVSFFETYISNESCQQVEALNGHHYLHWADADKMAAETTTFLSRQFG